MIIAVTESNNVYALDAANGTIIWQRNVVVILGNVDLCVCWKNRTPHTCSDKRRNGKYGFQRCVVDITAPILSCKGHGPPVCPPVR